MGAARSGESRLGRSLKRRAGDADTARMTLDLVGLALLGLFVALGAARGALAGALALVALGAAYAAGILAATNLGPGFAASFGLPRFAAPVVAGSASFAAVFLAV